MLSLRLVKVIDVRIYCTIPVLRFQFFELRTKSDLKCSVFAVALSTDVILLHTIVLDYMKLRHHSVRVVRIRQMRDTF